MIEESLLKSGILGKDGFVWWIGRVAKRDTWFRENLGNAFSGEQGFRCKVRIIGYHPFDNKLKEEDLPWAQVMLDAASGNAANGSTMLLQGGETCVGFFLDGEDAQQPVIIGLLHRNANVKESIDDELKRAEGETQFKNAPLYTGTKIPSTNIPKAKPNPLPQIPKLTETPTVEGTTNKAFCLWSDSPSSAAAAFEIKNTKPVRIPSRCSNDLIGGITRILQDFIAIVNTLEQSIGQFIDPLLNEIVDIANTIKNIAGQIGGIVKQIINSIRDGIIKCLISIFKKFFGVKTKINPAHPITGPALQNATKTLLQQIFCIFEKLIGEMIDFVIKMLENMINGVINPSICAAEQAVSGILAKLMSKIEELLKTPLSGIEWLIGGLGSISGILNQASTLATEIYNFIGCDEIKCNKPSEWISSTSVALQRGSDDWTKQLEGVNVLKGISNGLSQISKSVDAEVIIDGPLQKELNTAKSNLDRVVADDKFILVKGADSQIEAAEAAVQIAENNIERFAPNTTDINTKSYKGSSLSGLKKIAKSLGGDLSSIEGAIATISLFGSNNSSFGECNEKISNPRTQDDLDVPFGYKHRYCIPPIAVAFGSTNAAQLVPIVVEGSIVEVVVCAGGTGYSSPLSIAIIDNSGYGQGAEVDAIIGAGGSITGAIVISGGFDYCSGNYNNICSKVGVGIGSTNRKDPSILLTLTTSKNEIVEGNEFVITLKAFRAIDESTYNYTISGVDNDNIDNSLTGTFIIKDETSSLTIKTKQSLLDDMKLFTLKLNDYNEDIDVVIKKKRQIVKNPQYRLSSSSDFVNAGDSFTITLDTKEIPDNTFVPYTITGIDSNILTNASLRGNFEVSQQKSKITFRTNRKYIKDNIDKNVVFVLKLDNKKSYIFVLIKALQKPILPKPPGPVSGCIVDLHVLSPGIGYTSGDTITDGKNTYIPIVSPNGSIVKAQKINDPICGFTERPIITINTNTGVGAEVIPVMKYTLPGTETGNTGNLQSVIDQKQVINVVDCV